MLFRRFTVLSVIVLCLLAGCAGSQNSAETTHSITQTSSTPSLSATASGTTSTPDSTAAPTDEQTSRAETATRTPGNTVTSPTTSTPSPTPTPTATPSPTPDQPGVVVSVTSVTDGDMIDILFQNGTEDTVRLLGVDTPETYGSTSPEESRASQIQRLGVSVYAKRGRLPLRTCRIVSPASPSDSSSIVSQTVVARSVGSSPTSSTIVRVSTTCSSLKVTHECTIRRSSNPIASTMLRMMPNRVSVASSAVATRRHRHLNRR